METVLCSKQTCNWADVVHTPWHFHSFLEGQLGIQEAESKPHLFQYVFVYMFFFSYSAIAAADSVPINSCHPLSFFPPEASGSFLPPETFGILYKGRSDEFNFPSWVTCTEVSNKGHLITGLDIQRHCRQGLTLLTLWNLLESARLFLTPSHRDALRRTSKKTEEMKREEAKARV